MCRVHTKLKLRRSLPPEEELDEWGRGRDECLTFAVNPFCTFWLMYHMMYNLFTITFSGVGEVYWCMHDLFFLFVCFVLHLGSLSILLTKYKARVTWQLKAVTMTRAHSIACSKEIALGQGLFLILAMHVAKGWNRKLQMRIKELRTITSVISRSRMMLSWHS